MDIRTGRKLQETFTRVEVLFALVESLSKAVDEQAERIRQLEEQARNKPGKKWHTTPTS